MSNVQLVVSDLHLSLSQLDCDGVPSTRFRHAACICGNYLYIHGGRSGHRALRDFWRLNLKTCSWETVRLSNSSTSRPGLLEDHLMINFDEKIFLLGNGWDSLNRSEMQIWIFQPDSLSWIRPSIPQDLAYRNPLGRRSATGTVVGHKLYLFGGIIDLYAKATSELFELDLELYSWKLVETEGTLVAPPVYEHSTVTHGGFLYVFGGKKDQKVQNFLWKFDLSRKTWNRVLPSGRLPPARSGHSLFVYSESIFLHGGKSDQKILGDVWRFHFFSETWTKINMSEDCFLSHHVALLIPDESKIRKSFSKSKEKNEISSKIKSKINFQENEISLLDCSENHFSAANFENQIRIRVSEFEEASFDDSRIRSDSHEYLIPEFNSRNVPELRHSYDNDAMEMETIGSRKVARNLSASSEKRAKDKSKKQKSEAKETKESTTKETTSTSTSATSTTSTSRSSIRSLTKNENRTNQNAGIELMDLTSNSISPKSDRVDTGSATDCFSATDSFSTLDSPKKSSSATEKTEQMEEIGKFGKFLLIGGDSSQEVMVFKQSMRVRIVQIPDMTEI